LIEFVSFASLPIDCLLPVEMLQILSDDLQSTGVQAVIVWRV